MKKRIAKLALLVGDYDEAIAFYRDVMDFVLIEDTPQEAGKRWVVMAPPGGDPGSEGCHLLLAKAKNPEQEARIGDQTGRRVFLFLETDDFARDYAKLQAAGVVFNGPPREEAYGRVVVFEDLYGNKWDLIEPR